jgi:hypothetical protein
MALSGPAALLDPAGFPGGSGVMVQVAQLVSRPAAQADYSHHHQHGVVCRAWQPEIAMHETLSG